jgi:hypothetical protein
MQIRTICRATTLAGTLVLAVGFGVGLATPAGAHGKSHQGGVTTSPMVVADHLNNPRQLAVGPHGSLFVAEAGAGGPHCGAPGETGSPFCLGTTSSIIRIATPWKPGATTVIADGLPSGGNPDGSFAIGTNGVGVGGHGKVYAVNSASDGPPGPTSPAGKLFRVKNHKIQIIADLAKYELTHDPDGQGPDSDVYSVLTQKTRVLVADAAGNDVLAVSKKGTISTFHVFPNIRTGACASMPPEAPGREPGCDFVPTALAAGPHGSVFVTGLAAEVPGEGRVVQLAWNGSVMHEWSGFTTPVGVVAAPGGGFFVSELLANLNPTAPNPPQVGLVTRVGPGGARSSRVIPLPAGLAIIHGSLYVSVYSIAPASGLFGNPDWNGQVWKLSL